MVEIDAAGWRVISDPPVRFVRPRGLRQLPEPTPSSNFAGIRKLEDLVNLRGDDFKLYVDWIVGCLRPSGPYTVLVLSGEHGSAKSTAVRIACDLVDPHKVKTSGLPRSEQDLAIAASKRQVLPYDNLSEILGWMADALCRLATGGGLQKRMLCRLSALTGGAGRLQTFPRLKVDRQRWGGAGSSQIDPIRTFDHGRDPFLFQHIRASFRSLLPQIDGLALERPLPRARLLRRMPDPLGAVPDFRGQAWERRLRTGIEAPRLGL